MSGSASVQMLLETCSWIGLASIVARFGSTAVAGYTLAMRLAFFALMPAWGLAQAAATLVGQNLGAGHPDRAEKSVWVISAYNVGLLLVAGGVLAALAHPILGWFSTDLEVLTVAVQGIRLIALSFLAFAVGMVVVQALNGAGDPVTPAWLNVLCFWVLKLPLAYVLAIPLSLGPLGIFVSVGVAYTVMSALAVGLFRRGRWKEARV
jgi:Na+-driven multidrug efflux pump